MCEKCVQMEDEGKSFFCKGCSNDITIHGIAEWFMVSDAVWKESGAGKEEDLCVGCLEKLLKRKLVPADFGGTGYFPVNDLYEHSPRLRSRMGETREKGTIDGLLAAIMETAKARALKKRLERSVRPGYHVDLSEGYGAPGEDVDGDEEVKSCQ